MRVQTQTGIVEREGPMPVARVALVCQNCGKPTRVHFQIAATGEKIRTCQHCGEPVAVSK
jgi:large subunit ribosomal protein L24